MADSISEMPGDTPTQPWRPWLTGVPPPARRKLSVLYAGCTATSGRVSAIYLPCILQVHNIVKTYCYQTGNCSGLVRRGLPGAIQWRLCNTCHYRRHPAPPSVWKITVPDRGLWAFHMVLPPAGVISLLRNFRRINMFLKLYFCSSVFVMVGSGVRSSGLTTHLFRIRRSVSTEYGNRS